jgi:hypothetical protein
MTIAHHEAERPRRHTRTRRGDDELARDLQPVVDGHRELRIAFDREPSLPQAHAGVHVRDIRHRRDASRSITGRAGLDRNLDGEPARDERGLEPRPAEAKPHLGAAHRGTHRRPRQITGRVEHER